MENEVNKKEVVYNILDQESHISLTKVIYTGNIIGKFNTWRVDQEYLNLNKDKSVEIYYTFPLKSGATITSFEANIGDKVIKGIVKEKHQANREYQRAIAQGDSAYMMERFDSNMFKISLGRVMPDELIKITITYIEMSDVYDNYIDLLVPTLVGQRYNDIISNELIREDKVSYTCDFIVNLNENLSVKDVNSTSHKIKVINNQQVISLNNRLNRDFKLSVELNKEFKTTAIMNGQYLYIDIMPKFKESNERVQKKYVFVIDRSGSMKGRNIDAVKNLLKVVLAQLESDDLIEIISFGSDHTTLFHSLKMIGDVRKQLNEYISKLDANMGGTELLNALVTSLTYSNDANIIVITDGQVENEDYICNQIAHKIQNNHLFLFGLDMNVNTSFLDKLSKVGHGRAYYFAPDEGNYTDKMIRAFSNINGTISSQIKLTTNNKELDRYLYSDTLFNNEYWSAILKLDSFQEDIVFVVDGKEIVIKKEEIKPTNIELHKVFATCKIGYYESLMNRDDINSEGYKDLIIKMAIENQIDSKYTSFLAINERDQKVFDVPQIEETPVEHSFDRGLAELRCQSMESFNNFDISPRKISPRSKNQSIVNLTIINDYLDNKLTQLIELLVFNGVKKQITLIKEINQIIKTYDSIDLISNRTKELINSIKTLSKSVYNLLFVGVEDTIKKLFN